MKTTLLSIALAFHAPFVLASGDAAVPVASVEYTYEDPFTKDSASILVKYRSLLSAAPETGPLAKRFLDTVTDWPSSSHDHKIESITVKWQGSTIVIPREELSDLPRLQIDAIVFRHGSYQDGRSYHYIDTFFGDQEANAVDKHYKQVWLLMEKDQYIERKTFITVRTGPDSTYFKQLTQKFKGNPATQTGK